VSLISSDEHGVRWLRRDCPVCGDRGPHRNSLDGDLSVWQCFLCSSTFTTRGQVLS